MRGGGRKARCNEISRLSHYLAKHSTILANFPQTLCPIIAATLTHCLSTAGITLYPQHKYKVGLNTDDRVILGDLDNSFEE